MTIALYIGAACVLIISYFFAHRAGEATEHSNMRAERQAFWIFTALWAVATIGAAAMLIAGVKA